MKRGLFALGLAGALAVGGCAAHPSPEAGLERIYAPVDCTSSDPAERIQIVREDAAKILVADIYNTATEQERQLAIGPDGYALDASGEPGTQWERLPEAGQRIGALAVNADQSAVILWSGEPTFGSNDTRLSWAGRAVTALCMGDEARLRNPNGEFVLIAAD